LKLFNPGVLWTLRECTRHLLTEAGEKALWRVRISKFGEERDSKAAVDEYKPL